MPTIDILDEAEKLKSYWQLRDAQMVIDRDIVNLVPPPKKADEVQWMSNEPKIFYDTAVGLVSSYAPRFRLPISTNFSDEQKAQMNKAERFLIGIFRNLDYTQMSRGQTYWLRDLAYWVLSGWYAVFNAVIEENGETKFIADMWDPITVYPEWTSDGLTKCVRCFQVDKRTALMLVENWKAKGLKTEFKEPLEDQQQLDVINYWRVDKKEVRNAIYINGSEVKPLTLEKQFDKIPILVGAVGIPERGSPGWQARFGEHIIAANRDMYDYENRIIRLMATILAETAYPNLVSKTQSGEPVSKDGLRGYGEETPLKVGESMELLKHAATPEEGFQLLSWIVRQRQKASFSDATYGSIPNVEISGFALSQYMASIRYKIGPYLTTMQYIVSNVASEMLRQYKQNKLKSVTLLTTNPKELKRGLFFMEEFTPSDVPDVLYVNVTIPITSAMDKTQQIIFARQALSPPQLLSRETIWDEYLDVQDSEQEYIRILQDETLEMPVMKQIAAMEGLRQRERLYRSQGKIGEAQALHKYILALEMELGMRKAIPETLGTEGIRPEALPPEMGAQGLSPDVLNSALGKGPPGLRRRPQSPQERQESQKGFVSATGETLIP